MRTLLNIIIPILLLTSCSNDDEIENEYSNNLLDSDVQYLLFNDDIRFTDNNFTFSQLDSIVFNYQNQNITKVIGGFEIYDPFSSYLNKRLTNDIYDSIIKLNDTYKVYTHPETAPYYFTDNPENPVEYIISNNQIQKAIRRDGLVLNYYYGDNLILEKNDENLLLRKFYLENNNLIKVEKFKYDLNFEINDKTEILFQEYDSSPNPFKGKHYLLGAFYRSFSENNYSNYVINAYDRLDDGTFQLYYTLEVSTPFGYNDDNYPLFGNYE
ncbi:hypothetical protein [Mangrovimonas spongiae]|uniref:Uncharacterized protein n=1 Tax=Mangrovimonas spongiae TaxID=2494697 RepID=A0A3R9N8T6_9FLAO|nr:hypothetical protein [Mangrovimonas spongiae]RSK41659.1 hypothetical protein EJA19_01935 [Mangrovimonas spongiae]